MHSSIITTKLPLTHTHTLIFLLFFFSKKVRIRCQWNGNGQKKIERRINCTERIMQKKIHKKVTLLEKNDNDNEFSYILY